MIDGDGLMIDATDEERGLFKFGVAVGFVIGVALTAALALFMIWHL